MNANFSCECNIRASKDGITIENNGDTGPHELDECPVQTHGCAEPKRVLSMDVASVSYGQIDVHTSIKEI